MLAFPRSRLSSPLALLPWDTRPSPLALRPWPRSLGAWANLFDAGAFANRHVARELDFDAQQQASATKKQQQVTKTYCCKRGVGSGWTQDAVTQASERPLDCQNMP